MSYSLLDSIQDNEESVDLEIKAGKIEQFPDWKYVKMFLDHLKVNLLNPDKIPYSNSFAKKVFYRNWNIARDYWEQPSEKKTKFELISMAQRTAILINQHTSRN